MFIERDSLLVFHYATSALDKKRLPWYDITAVLLH